MSGTLTRRWLVGLFLVSFALRIGLVLALGAHEKGIETAYEHASIAESLATGQGFRFNFFGRADEPVYTSQQAPLVPGLLAGCYLLFGAATPAAFLAMLLVQCAASAATVVATAWTAQTCDRRIGRWTGVGACVYPPLLASCLHVQALVWNLLWLSLLLAGAQAVRSRRTALGGGLFVAGGIGGLLSDPILGIVIAVLLALLLWEGLRDRPFPLTEGGGERRPRFVRFGLVTALAAAVSAGISPWVIRNWQVHGRFVLIKDSFYYVLWQGNNEVSQGTDKLLVDADDASAVSASLSLRGANRAAFNARSRAEDVNVCLTPELIASLQTLPTEIERMDRFREIAIPAITDHPGRYLRLCARRLCFWLWFDLTNPRSFSPYYRLSYLSLLALAVVGIAGSIRKPRRWAPIYLAVLGLTAVHVLIITSARFRIPLELMLIPFAGLTFSLATARLARKRPAGSRSPVGLGERDSRAA